MKKRETLKVTQCKNACDYMIGTVLAWFLCRVITKIGLYSDGNLN
jgi:uncharacterized protein YijF (DUF1287 family)